MPDGTFISVILMLMALLVSRKIIFAMPKGDDAAIERLARAFLALGLITAASLPGASGSVWQAWVCVGFLAAAAIFGLIAFAQHRRRTAVGEHG